MRKVSTPSEPRFLWTGLMILIPVLGLGAVGFWQLRQDRSAALAEAQSDVENDLKKALQIGKKIVLRGPEEHDAIFSDKGELVWPKPIPIVPVPPPAPSPHFAQLNNILNDPTLSLPEQAHALEEFSYDENTGLSAAGFPLRQLALRNALRLGKKAELESTTLQKWAAKLTAAAIENPTILSDKLLQEAQGFHARGDLEIEEWHHAEASRKFLREHSSEIHQLIKQKDEPTTSSWLGSTFCHLRRDFETAYLNTISVNDLEQKLHDQLALVSLPQNLAIRLSLAERLVHGDPDAEVLSVINDTKSQIRAEIVFTDRAAFFQPVRERSTRTAWLIGLAVMAAGTGWFTAWRSFVRQQQLATMKDNFVSAVSHELKAPIASIGLMAEELGAGSQKRTDYTRLIAGECARLGSLVENLLDYARIESRQDGFSFEDADLGEMVRAAAELMRPPAAERGMTIQVEAPPPGQLCATVDARALGRSLINLLDNAIKYAPSETFISLIAKNNQITVCDQGRPIPASESSRIFDRFYRSGSELTRETKGVGIGLSLVRHIALAHGGKVWVESDHTGNQFIFQIGNKHFQPTNLDA